MHRKSLSAAAVVVALTVAACADQPASDLGVGGSVGAYKVVKAGGMDDGVEVGKSLCYMWKLGPRPVAMIYVRKIDDGLTSLVKKLESMVPDNEDKQFAVLVAFIGGEVDALKSAAADFASTNKITQAVVVVPDEQPDGPKNYGISADATTSVFLYKGKKVEAAYVLPTGGLDKNRIAAIVADADKILK